MIARARQKESSRVMRQLDVTPTVRRSVSLRPLPFPVRSWSG